MSDYNRRYRPMPFPINQSAQTLIFSTRELKEMIECYLRNKGQIVSVGDFQVDPVKLTVTVVNSIAASFNLTPQPLAVEPGGSGGGAQLQAFAETGSYWFDSALILPVFVAEAGNYWLDSVEAAFAETGSYWLDSTEIAPLFVAETGSYWLDSTEAAIAETGSYWLDSAVESPVFVAETGSYWLDSVAETRNTTLLNALSYAAINNANYGYFNSNTNMPALYDGNLSNGMMAVSFAGTEAVYIQVQLAVSSYINRIVFYGGQFNGSFNIPDSIKIYAGLVTAGTAATPIYSGNLAFNTEAQNIALTSVTALNAPLTQFTIAFAKNGTFDNTISVNELQLKGHSA